MPTKTSDIRILVKKKGRLHARAPLASPVVGRNADDVLAIATAAQ